MTSEVLKCPMTGDPCDNSKLCTTVNEPLIDGIASVRRGVDNGVSVNQVRHALKRELGAQLDPLGVDVPIASDGAFGLTICPREVLEGSLGDKFGPSAAADGVRNIAATCVQHVIADLNR